MLVCYSCVHNAPCANVWEALIKGERHRCKYKELCDRIIVLHQSGERGRSYMVVELRNERKIGGEEKK